MGNKLLLILDWDVSHLSAQALTISPKTIGSIKSIRIINPDKVLKHHKCFFCTGSCCFVFNISDIYLKLVSDPVCFFKKIKHYPVQKVWKLYMGKNNSYTYNLSLITWFWRQIPMQCNKITKNSHFNKLVIIFSSVIKEILHVSQLTSCTKPKLKKIHLLNMHIKSVKEKKACAVSETINTLSLPCLWHQHHWQISLPTW